VGPIAGGAAAAVIVAVAAAAAIIAFLVRRRRRHAQAQLAGGGSIPSEAKVQVYIFRGSSRQWLGATVLWQCGCFLLMCTAS
jgi:hypothetical protein